MEIVLMGHRFIDMKIEKRRKLNVFCPLLALIDGLLLLTSVSMNRGAFDLTCEGIRRNSGSDGCHHIVFRFDLAHV
jgi:hypothetical protein